MNFFFYGTLMDGEVLSAVVGRDADRLARSSARLSGYRRCRARGASYPVIVTAAGAQTAGVLVSGLTATDARRLAAYEGEGYRSCRCTVRRSDGARVAAWLFVPRCRRMATTAPWSLADWQRTHKAAFLAHLAGGERAGGSATTADRRHRRQVR
ncbi:MAG: gamma-glutamylcyclotransferase [Rhodospirillales bacterium]|jgi:gamma-glutamylcyclotransferase (GGCT)/AIG2-like uncharacterized protein YtfP|nr:gamma-glutamylcyclotransferase [Rhodospirillales bacterium]